MRVPFNDLSSHHANLQPALDEALLNVVRTSAFIGGPDIAQFEAEFAAYCETPDCAAVGNGTDALEMALRTLGVGPGDEVIVPSMTFIATAESVAIVGAAPVVVDVLADVHTMDPEKLEAAITPRTKAVIPVHLYGQPCDMDPIIEISVAHGLHVIEDAAQAHGARYKGRPVGTIGHMAAFSFYPGKNLGALGDAGAVVSTHTDLVTNVKRLRDHGRLPDDKFGHSLIGRNCRLDTLQAAALRIKLPHLDNWIRRRREIAGTYNEALRGIVQVPEEIAEVESVYHLYVILVDDRDGVRDRLREAGVASGVHYPTPTHLHPAMTRAYGYRPGDFVRGEQIANHALSLPIFPEMSDDQVTYCVDMVKQAVGHA